MKGRNHTHDLFESVSGWRADLCRRQILIDWTKLTPARILVLFVTLGVLLGAIGLYEPLVKWAGMGASVP